MADIAELERRLSAAMDRIGTALESTQPSLQVDAEMLALAHSVHWLAVRPQIRTTTAAPSTTTAMRRRRTTTSR